MIHKHLLICILAVAIFAGSGAGWYLFEQSTKLKRLNHDQERELSGHIRQKVVSNPGQRIENNASQVIHELTNEPDQQDRAASDPESSRSKNASWVEKHIFTPYLVQDVARFLVEHYSPPKSLEAGNDRGSIQISFKIINARYGIDFLSLHSPDKGIKQARSQVLQYTLNPEILEGIYTTYVHEVLDAFQAQALQARKRTYAPNGKKEKEVTLSSEQVAKMFGLYAAYFQDVGSLLSILSHNQSLAEDIQRYLQAEQEAIHAGYLLKQRRYDAWRGVGEERAGNIKMQEEKDRQEQLQAVERYRQALRHREQTKARILGQVQAQAPKLGLPTHEIMYVAQWVHRRLLEGEKSQALDVASDLLQDFARQLNKRSRTIQIS
jgi:hypothetical protein